MTTYILNLVSPKSVLKTSIEIWSGQKISLHHIRICGCPVNVLRNNQDKLGSRSEVCLFVGYPKGTI